MWIRQYAIPLGKSTMYCSKCGSQCDDQQKFCQKCGAPLEQTSSQAQQPVPPEAQTPPPADGNPVQNENYLFNKIQGCLKAVLKSPIYILAASLLTLSILLKIIPSSSADLFSFLKLLPASELGVLSILFDYLDVLENRVTSWMIGLNFIAQLPSILVALGVWLMFAEGMQNTRPISSTGLTIIKVIYIIKTIGYALLTALLAVVGIWFCAESNSLWGLILVLLPIPALLFCIFLLKTLRDMIYTVSVHMPARYVSGYVIVIGWVEGIFSCITAFFSATVFAGLCGALAWIFFAVFLSQYKKAIYTI